ncbi:MAG: hypothetical protein IPJ06_15425 [Saprospiraceae bacterium]|nr:hypothetical protein [Saprospiraceae bacterium]
MIRFAIILLGITLCFQCKKMDPVNFYKLSVNDFEYESKYVEFLFLRNDKDTLNRIVVYNPILLQDSINSKVDKYQSNWSCRVLSSEALLHQWSILDGFEQECFNTLVKEEKYSLEDTLGAIRDWSAVHSYGRWITNRDSMLWNLTINRFKEFLFERNNNIDNEITRLDSCENDMYVNLFSELENNVEDPSTIYLTLF